MAPTPRLAVAVALLEAQVHACTVCGSCPSPRWTGTEYVLECPMHPDAKLEERR